MFLSNRIPVLAIENDVMFMKNGSYGIGYEIVLPEVGTLGLPGYDKLNKLWQNVYNSLPDECIMHKQDQYFLRNWEPRFTEVEDNPLLNDYIDGMHGRKYIEQKTRIYFTKLSKIVTSAKQESLFASIGILFKKNKTIINTEIPKREIESFLEVIQAVKETIAKELMEYKCTVKLIEENDYLGTQEKLFKGEVDQYLYQGSESTSDIQFMNDRISVGGGFAQIIAIDDLNAFTGRVISPLAEQKTWKVNLSFMHALGFMLPFNHTTNSYFYKTNQKKLIVNLEKKQRSVNILANISTINGNIATAINNFLIETEEKKKTICYCHFNILFTAPTEADLNSRRTTITSILSDLNIRSNISTVDLPQLYWAGFPNNANDLKPYNFMTMHLDAALSLMINESPIRNKSTSESKVQFRLSDRVYGNPIDIDLNNLPKSRGYINNYNMAVFGPSGSGKSFLMNAILFPALLNKDDVMILDKGGSYDNLLEIFGGNYFVYTDPKSFSFNPFYVSSFVDISTQKKLFIRSLIFSLYFEKEEDFDDKVNITFFDDIIHNYYREYFDKPSFKLNFDSFYHFVNRSEKNANDYIKSKIDFDKWEFVMKRFTVTGEFPYLLNNEKEVDLVTQKLTVFETNGIKENKELYQVVSLIYTNLYISKLLAAGENPAYFTYAVFEEAWDSLGDPKYLSFYKWMLKTSRKHKGKPIIVTQELQDIFENKEVGRTILVNCPTIVLLDLSDYKSKIKEVYEILQLDEADIELLNSLNKFFPNILNKREKRKEVWIKQGTSPAVAYSVEITPKMFWAFNTNKEDKFLVTKLKELLDGDVMIALDVINQITNQEFNKYLAEAKMISDKGESITTITTEFLKDKIYKYATN